MQVLRKTNSTLSIFSTLLKVKKDDEGNILDETPQTKGNMRSAEVRTDIDASFRKFIDYDGISFLINFNQYAPNFVLKKDAAQIGSYITIASSLIIEDGFFHDEYAKNENQSIVCGLIARFKLGFNEFNQTIVEDIHFDVIDNNEKSEHLNVDYQQFNSLKKELIEILNDQQTSIDEPIIKIQNTVIS